MTVTTARQRPTLATRRVGYGVAMAVNAVLLYLINVSPGWDAVPFLTDGTTQVLGWVNASIVAGIVANALYVVVDRRWFRPLGERLVTLIGLTALVRLGRCSVRVRRGRTPLARHRALGLGHRDGGRRDRPDRRPGDAGSNSQAKTTVRNGAGDGYRTRTISLGS